MQPDLCAYPGCDNDLRGGAILVSEDNERTPLCMKHMTMVFEAAVIGIAQAMSRGEQE